MHNAHSNSLLFLLPALQIIGDHEDGDDPICHGASALALTPWQDSNFLP